MEGGKPGIIQFYVCSIPVVTLALCFLNGSNALSTGPEADTAAAEPWTFGWNTLLVGFLVLIGSVIIFLKGRDSSRRCVGNLCVHTVAYLCLETHLLSSFNGLQHTCTSATDLLLACKPTRRDTTEIHN